MRQFVKFVGISVFLLISIAATCQQPPQPSPAPAGKRDWREVWRNATVSFGEVARDSLNQEYFHALGTGIIVNTDEHTAYLVTARHVFCDPDKVFHPSQL